MLNHKNQSIMKLKIKMSVPLYGSLRVFREKRTNMGQLNLFFLLFLVAIVPKSYSQNAIVIAGGDVSGSGGKASYSVGQIVYTFVTGPNGSVYQGVQQPIEIFTLGNDNFSQIKLTMVIYPNPTSSFVNLKVEKFSLDDLEYNLFDWNGKILSNKKIIDSETKISLENLSSQTYLLNITSQNKTIKTFKIIKN